MPIIRKQSTAKVSKIKANPLIKNKKIENLTSKT